MEYRDYYAVLGVKRDATQAEIKRAYRKLARTHHPDLKPGDAAAERRFKEVNEANEVLSDPDKRAKYDTLGANWESVAGTGRGGSGGGAGAGRAGGGGPFQGGPFGSGPFAGAAGGNVRYEFRTSGGEAGGAGGFSDFFRTFFGGAGATEEGAGSGPAGASSGTRRGRARTGQGQSFEEVLGDLGLAGQPGQGGGLGGAFGSAGAHPGGGRPSRSVEADVGLSLEEAFHGTSRIVQINGTRLEVTVPAGVETGSRIRLKGRGGGDPRHPADLYLVTRVAAHPIFGRTGADLTRELPISLGEALLGAEIPVSTLKGRGLLRIPAGTQSGRTFRLKAQGMPRLRPKSGELATGDLLVKVRLVLPSDLSDETLVAARRFVELAGQPDPRRGPPASITAATGAAADASPSSASPSVSTAASATSAT